MAKSLIDAIKDRDWHAANEAFAGLMQTKIADRLVAERKELFKEQDGRFDALDNKKEKQHDDDAAEDDAKKKGPSAEVDKDDPKKIIVKEAEEKKYILWALPKGATDRLHEQPMTSMPLTAAQVEKVKSAASKDGWHGFRTTVEDGAVPDFGTGIVKEDSAKGAKCLTCGGTYPCRGVLQGTHSFKSDAGLGKK